MTPVRVTGVLAVVLPLLMPAGGGGAMAQGLDFASRGDSPVEVFADQGIEWQQEGKRLIALGNARAVRDTVTVHGDSLTAHYRDKESGGTEIWRLEAEGSVRIVSPTETVDGDIAVYDVDTARLTVRGQPARMVTPREVITARDSLEYHEVERKAIARGDALVVTEDNRRLKADRLTAVLVPADAPGKGKAAPRPAPPRPGTAARGGPPGGAGESKIKLINADGHVSVETPNEIVFGDTGVYTVETGIATITGSVKISRGENQLNGEYAVVNLRTGVSRLYASRPGRTDRNQVKLLLVPERKSDDRAGGTGK
ncbi:MAG: hypothetical protein H7840_08400 [Alphaproteobacteria bacterium]